MGRIELLLNRLNSRSRTVKLAVLVNICLVVLLLGYFHYPTGEFYVPSKPKDEVVTSTHKLDNFFPKDEAVTSTHKLDNFFPKKIWQVYLSPPGKPKPIDPKKIPEIVTWVARNPDYDYNLVGDHEMLDFLGTHWNKTHPVLYDIFTQMSHPSMRSDLSRFVLMASYGGVYSDTDVEDIKPIDQWIPTEFKDKARIVIGIEFDRLDGSGWSDVHEDLQFVLWTVMSVRGHPIFTRMIDKAIGALQAHLQKNNMTWTNMKVTSSEVMKLTGPGIWTDGVYEHILESHPSFTLRDLTGLTKPTMIDDILILPIDGFGMGQPHSHSTNDGTIPADALVRHKFAGSWRSDKSMVSS